MDLIRNKALIKRIAVVMISVMMLALILGISEKNNTDKSSFLRIERNGYGEGQKEETLRMQIEGEPEEEVEIRISPRKYSEEEVQILYEKAENMLNEIVLGENTEGGHVEKDLRFVNELEGFPFQISWELSRYDVIDMTGKVLREKIREADPENKGVPVTVTAILKYDSQEEAHSMNMTVFAGEEGGAALRERVKTLIEKLDEESQEEAYVTLPESVDGKSIIWSRKRESRGVPILILGVIASVLLICIERQKEEKQKQEKQKQMLLDYPEIVSQFTMLMEAGMTAKNVWRKLAGDYLITKQMTGRERAAYEEILYTWKEMESGIPEGECYERFVRRCNLMPYRKLGSMLSQNLKKGTRGMGDMLHMEAVQAMEDRKSNARRLGEEAGTRLLIPMLMMLVIVLTIVIVPAFLSVQI